GPSLALIVEYIDQHKDQFGVEPICAVLTGMGAKIAPSTYYARKARPPSDRAVRDQAVTAKLREVHARNYGVYGIRKMYAALARLGGVNGLPVARCTIQRLMKAAGLKGVSRRKTPRTTVAGKGIDTRADHVKRNFTATAPDQLWVADFTYVRTLSGWVYAAFILDVFSRKIVGWRLSRNMRTDLALDALQMAIWARQRDGRDLSGLIHHSDRGVQYVDVRYTARLEEAEAVASVGSKGDSYDNAMAEALNSVYKAELVRNLGPWNGIDDLEIATAEYIDWYNNDRLHEALGHVPPAEHEANFYTKTPATELITV
ncbi:IS3 family transposase, partial [Kineosporia babensis]